MAGAISSGVASGFALAAQPVCAQTVVHTDVRYLTAEMVQVPTENGTIPAYCAKPAPSRVPPQATAMTRSGVRCAIWQKLLQSARWIATPLPRVT